MTYPIFFLKSTLPENITNKKGVSIVILVEKTNFQKDSTENYLEHQNFAIFGIQFDNFGRRYEIKGKKHFLALSRGQRCPPWNSNLKKPYRYVTDLHGNVYWLPWHSLNEAFYLRAKLLHIIEIMFNQDKCFSTYLQNINLILNIEIKLKCRRTHGQNSHSKLAPPRGHLFV